MPPKGGVRQQLGLDNASQKRPNDAGAATTGASNSSVGPKPSLRRRVGADIGEASASTDVPLMSTLKVNWGKGKLSAHLVNDILKAAAASEAKNLPSLAKNPQHLQASLMAKIGKPEGCPELTWVELPFRSGKCMHPIFCPHDWFHSMYTSSRTAWDKRVRGPGRSPYRYWQNMEQTKIVQDHPVRTKEMWGDPFHLVFTAMREHSVRTTRYMFPHGIRCLAKAPLVRHDS